jgi:hypothetical protein
MLSNDSGRVLSRNYGPAIRTPFMGSYALGVVCLAQKVEIGEKQ